jgi:hypothetical protein
MKEAVRKFNETHCKNCFSSIILSSVKKDKLEELLKKVKLKKDGVQIN